MVAATLPLLVFILVIDWCKQKQLQKKKCTANPSAALRKKSILCPYKNFHRKILLQIAKSNMVKLRTSKPGMLFLTSWCREQVEVLRDVQYLV